jgi:hypothetical protein
MVVRRGGLAPQIMLGFFSRGNQKIRAPFGTNLGHDGGSPPIVLGGPWEKFHHLIWPVRPMSCDISIDRAFYIDLENIFF